MGSDASPYEPIPTTWFSAQPQYIALGKLVASPPWPEIAGPTVVSLDDWGTPSIKMSVECMSSGRCLPGFAAGAYQADMGLVEAGAGEQPVDPLEASRGPDYRFHLQTTDGTLISAGGRVHFSEHYKPPKTLELELSALRTEFHRDNAAPPTYWVLPITNLVSECVQHQAEFDQHPLRLWSTPNVPTDLDEGERVFARWTANSKNNLICFRFRGKPGFIEALPGYDVRRRELESGKVAAAITAVMVGEVAVQATRWPEVASWLPGDFGNLLSLATGTRVEFPWVEFRDAGASLVSRIHFHFHPVPFDQGDRPISEIPHQGTGHLLTRAALSRDFRNEHLRVAIRNLVASSGHRISIDSGLRQVFVALGALCIKNRANKRSPEDPIRVLSAARSAAVEQLLTSTLSILHDLAARAQADGADAEEACLLRIAARFQSATDIDDEVSFGSAVAKLLEQFSQHDADIMAAYFRTHRMLGKSSWAQYLSKARGLVAHQGFLGLDQFGGDWEPALRTLLHLRDIVLRIILKTLGYEGTYQPAVLSHAAACSLDWITAATRAEDLGYP
jgi:hypothetical protein